MDNKNNKIFSFLMFFQYLMDNFKLSFIGLSLLKKSVSTFDSPTLQDSQFQFIFHYLQAFKIQQSRPIL